MTKSELRTGMVVTDRNGQKYIVYRNFHYQSYNGSLGTMDVLVSHDGNCNWCKLDSFQENLMLLSSGEENVLDIVKVEAIKHPYLTMIKYDKANFKTIWERNDAKKMTVAEIESILGYKVEIISEK